MVSGRSGSGVSSSGSSSGSMGVVVVEGTNVAGAAETDLGVHVGTVHVHLRKQRNRLEWS